MKIIKYSIFATLALMLASCNDWLEVNPRTEMPESELFSTENGFRDALTGVYINMKGADTYGKNLSFGNVENFAMLWRATGEGDINYLLGTYDFNQESSKSAISSMYNGLYKTIAYSNNIIANVNSRGAVIKTPGMAKMIKGESLGIRAYCHLDLLRMFGPVPKLVADGNAPILVYADTVTKDITPHIGYKAFCEKLIADLDQAEELLKDSDPILQIGTPEDNYLKYREVHLNYYAIKALKARAYLWMGNREKAYQYAKEVIDAKLANGTKRFPLQTLVVNDDNYTLTKEHIFGLHKSDMFNDWTNYFQAESGYHTGTLGTASDNTSKLNLLFTNDATDFRRLYLWTSQRFANGSQFFGTIIKYSTRQMSSNPSYDLEYRRIPMLRISEMYLIAVESTNDATERTTLWTQFVKDSRKRATVAAITSDALMMQEITREYRREFFAEGQTFYALKRFNAPVNATYFLWTPLSKAITDIAVNYVIPLPEKDAVVQ